EGRGRIHTRGEPATRAGANVGAQGGAIIARLLDDALLVQIPAGDECGEGWTARAHTDVHVAHRSGAGDLVEPVDPVPQRCRVPAPMAPTPRIWIWGPPPGIPLLWLICTPATWPARAWSTPVTGRDLMFSVLTPATDPVTSALRRVPYPTATIASSSMACALSWRL